MNDLDIGTYNAEINVPGYNSITTQIRISDNDIITKEINILTAESAKFNFIPYQHNDYKEPYKGGRKLNHISVSDHDIKMMGYTDKPFKDVLITNQNDDPSSFIHAPQKILSFNIKRDSNNWHTIEGGGFLFDVSLTGDKITAHCVLITQKQIKLYKIERIDFYDFMDGKLGDLSYFAKELGSYDLPNSTTISDHSITVKINKNTKEYITVYDGGKIVINRFQLDKLSGDDFGPITSYCSHACEQISSFTFSDIKMNNVR